MEFAAEIKTLIRELEEHFFVRTSSLDKTLADIDAAAALLRPDVRRVLESFRHSLTSTIATVAMPLELAGESVKKSHFQRLHAAERIRAMSFADLLSVDDKRVEDPAKEEMALNQASSRAVEFFHSKEGKAIVIRDIWRLLLEDLEHGFGQSAAELLEQGVVLIWSAFEVLCRDAFELILNTTPEKAKDLIEDSTARKRFQVDRLPFDTLLQFGFDLSRRLGSVLVGQQDFSDLRTIKAVYSAVFRNCKELHQALSAPQLWLLCQRRHLVVHRRCVVDQDYLDATGESHAVGTHLVVTPKDIESGLEAVISVAVELARALSASHAS